MKKTLLLSVIIFSAVGFCLWSMGIGARPGNEDDAPRLSSTPVEILPPDPRPNIVLINLDDADYTMFSPEMLQLYPGFNELAKRSISFTNVHVTTPFCGPSRAALFRGQYAHRTGVRVNIPTSPLSQKFKGGYSEFLRQGHDHDELGVWLKQGGYRTMLIGKYHHNGFDNKKPDGYDDFYTSLGGRYLGAYEFTTREDPQGKPARNGLDVYRTDREAEDAVNLIRQHATRRKLQTNSGEVAQPFFLYYAPLAPHRPVGLDFTNMVDKTKYADWQAELEIPRTPDFDEEDMFDKPPHRQSPPYSKKELQTLHDEYRSRARAVKSVDDFVIKLVAELKAKGQYDNTWFLITSDNGYQLGQHRLHNKQDPYRMSTTAPLFVCGPEVKQPAEANHLLAHIDLCPTILDLAQCPKPDFLDGKSFLELIVDPQSHPPASWREPVLLENWQVKRNRTDYLPGAYSGLRYHDRLYIEWVTGDREYYDLSADPWELENTFDALSAEEKQQLRKDLFASRKVKMNPIVTVMHRPVVSAHKAFPCCVRGMAEDDRCIERIRLTVRHAQRGYWNGESWQRKRISLETRQFAADQQLVAWRYDIRDAISQLTMEDSTVIDDRRVFPLMLQATAWDNEQNASEKAGSALNVPFTRDPFQVRSAEKPGTDLRQGLH